jgi:predicted HicB family RNase H-like nuclease
MTAISYRGHFANVEFDAEDEIFTGRLAGVNDVVGFHADNVEALKAAFREAVDDYVETCEKAGKTPEKPYSGQIMVRVDPAVHAMAALAAQLTGKSLTKWTEERLREAAERDTAAAVVV